jgi:hypothetical protein
VLDTVVGVGAVRGNATARAQPEPTPMGWVRASDAP